MGWKLAVFSVVLGAGLLIGFYLVHHHRSKEEAELADQTNLTSSEPATVDTVYVKPARHLNLCNCQVRRKGGIKA